METWQIILLTYICMIVVSYIIHKLVGEFLKSKLRKDNKYKLYERFDRYEKDHRATKETIKIKIIFFIPLVNIMIAFIEIFNTKKTYVKLLDALKAHEMKESKMKK